MADLITTRNVRVKTTLEEGVVALEQMEGHETLGQPFVYELSLVSTDWNIDLSKLLGQPVTVECDLPTGTMRYFHGLVTRASHLDGEGDFARYGVTLQPWLSMLDYGSECRIFQQMSVPEIVEQVFRRAGFDDFEDTLDPATYEKLEYCVQYRESDFNFVSRLMEHEGIYYFFRHEAAKHILVMADAFDAHNTQPGYELIRYKPPKERDRAEDEHLSSWVVAQQVRAGAFATVDFDFKLPRNPLYTALSKPLSHAHAQYEVFDSPGDFVKKGVGETRVKRRLEERQFEHELVQSSGDVRGPGSGHLFTLQEFPRDDQNKQYLVVSALYSVHAGDYETSGGGDAGEEFRVSYTLLDSKVPYRPPMRAHKSRVEGPQTAIVVGEGGREIWTDKFGRVMVQFHWDRYGMSDEKSSCWVRVSQVWAGAKWGSLHVPRIGQEVIVDFLEGDPDRPIITGRVYNGDNMPPYLDPDAPTETATQSGIKSRSTPGGTANNFNEIRFEDKKGKEEFHIQAERDHSTLVKRNQSISVGADRSVSVGGNESISVTGTRTSTITKKETQTFKDDRLMTVAKTNTDEVTLLHTGTYKLGRTETVSAADDNLTVNGAQKIVTVHGEYNTVADTQFEVKQAANKFLIKDQIVLDNVQCQVDMNGGNTKITAADEIKLVCGSASITLKKDGTIEISGSQKVKVDGGGAGVELTAAGATMSGAKATVSGASVTEITGGMVKIN
ncbi:MAG: type VI secretion system tip protein TssI/VgrG [Pseudomonadota bacterium]